MLWAEGVENQDYIAYQEEDCTNNECNAVSGWGRCQNADGDTVHEHDGPDIEQTKDFKGHGYRNFAEKPDQDQDCLYHTYSNGRQKGRCGSVSVQRERGDTLSYTARK